MYAESDIIQCFDASTWDYLGYKNRGGINAQKGGRYEDSFAIYKLVTLAQAVIDIWDWGSIYNRLDFAKRIGFRRSAVG